MNVFLPNFGPNTQRYNKEQNIFTLLRRKLKLYLKTTHLDRIHLITEAIRYGMFSPNIKIFVHFSTAQLIRYFTVYKYALNTTLFIFKHLKKTSAKFSAIYVVYIPVDDLFLTGSRIVTL